MINYEVYGQLKAYWQGCLGGYNTLGQLVKVLLVNDYQPAERYPVKFDGNSFSAGVYFYTLWGNDHLASSRKILLVK